MKTTAQHPTEYIDSLPEERKVALAALRKTILKNVPKGFKEVMENGMIAYVVPLSIYPNGYHCDASKPLPFMGIVAQKNFIVLHHLGLYGSKKLFNWFVNEYPKHSTSKIDMGKGCIRFKKESDIPHDLIAELVQKLTPEMWIGFYEEAFKSTKPSKK